MTQELDWSRILDQVDTLMRSRGMLQSEAAKELGYPVWKLTEARKKLGRKLRPGMKRSGAPIAMPSKFERFIPSNGAAPLCIDYRGVKLEVRDLGRLDEIINALTKGA